MPPTSPPSDTWEGGWEGGRGKEGGGRREEGGERREEGGGREGTVVTMFIVATIVIVGVFCNQMPALTPG